MSEEGEGVGGGDGVGGGEDVCGVPQCGCPVQPSIVFKNRRWMPSLLLGVER